MSTSLRKQLRLTYILRYWVSISLKGPE